MGVVTWMNYFHLGAVDDHINRGGTRACFHHSDFQSKNFSYAIFIVQKRPLYVNFSIPPCGK
jgi:hypothetical protein